MKSLFMSMIFACALFAQGQLVSYEVDGKMYEGYYSSPSKDAPLVYMVHDWDGMTEYEQKRAKMLYDLGYATFATDLYGKGVKPQTVEEKKALSGSLYKNRVLMRKLLNAGLMQAKKLGANINNAVGIGYCFGGAAILEMARSGAELKSFITFHGGLKTPKGQDYSQIKGSVVVLHGSADKPVPIDHFTSLAKELEEQKVEHEMILYSSAPHAFTIFGSKKYHEVADKKSWKRFVEVLEETLK